MQLVSYLRNGTEALGVLVDDRVIAARDCAPDAPATMRELLEAPPPALASLRAANPVGGTPIGEVDLLAPLPRPINVICVGRNYREHAAEEGKDAPEAPALFLKTTTSVVGHGAEVVWDPTYAEQVDYEAELAVIIGSTARHVSPERALEHVLGYTCLNDVSARDLQFADLQWSRGKSLDTFCPMGPALVTPDEVGDPQRLEVRCLLNGEVVQQASTAVMYHSIAQVIAYCSRAMTLHPGDVIATGTPGGVGIFREPPLLLGDGDVVEVDIERVGRLTNPCRARHQQA
ncbi:fumarylacetoacetate hydrolase family protein [Saccharopolyspora griseoalba]|uniref:Fumarylacetoacetate hydrolase family protein n=1 Tax=Saccharopolyspora griseoalba TaxID=1431848 RepID=A0ABW2LNR6_9PSEU